MTPETKARILQLREQKCSAQEIAEQIGVTKDKTLDWLRELGLNKQDRPRLYVRPKLDTDRGPLPAGHPITCNLIGVLPWAE